MTLGLTGKAKMEYSVDQPAALGCQISFWYCIYDSSLIFTSSLELKMVRDKDEKSLLKISEYSITEWKKAKAFLGNQPGGYRLQLSYSPPFAGKPVVMLDDIQFENCADKDVPAGSDQLSCDFKNDTCSWYHDYTAGLLWERSNDKLNEKNSYMVITAKYGLNISSAARLISYPQTAGQNICVSFWYHIFGNSIGSLKFIAKYSGEEEMITWIRSGTQGSKWRFADLTFKSSKPIQFIIEAMVGGNQGRIAITDIMVYPSESGSCPPERECTFQGSLCGLLPQPAANFSWMRIRGSSQPANSSGPATDHTLGTEQGFYLSAHLWNHPVGARGAMMTAVMEPTASDGECLMFWYYMEGSEVGELNIYLQTFENSRESVPLWTQKGNQGKHWRHGRVTLRSSTPYQVIFEAIVGTGERRDIAIDDLTVLDGHCPPTGVCDFEMDFCGWVNSYPVNPQSRVDWDWLSGESEGHHVPSRDHTTNTALGHFAFFNPISHPKSDKEQVARLESETMDAVERACLEVWYYAAGWLTDYHSEIQLLVFVNDSDSVYPVLNTFGFMNSSWIQERVDYSAERPHRLILQANCSCSDMSIALDDIYIMRNESCNEITPTTTPNPPTTTSSPPSAMDCTFEHGLCSWVQEVSGDVNWTRSKGLPVDLPWDGPQYDHTVGNNEGLFLVLNGSGINNVERAVISVPLLKVTSSHICIGFWYHMLGPSVSTLDLLLEIKSSEDVVWTRRGTQKPEWVHAEITVNRQDTSRLIITAHRNTISEGFIAIDDITVREGPCVDKNMCGFDYDLCGFHNSVTHKGQWIRKRATEEEVDHTRGTDNGFYVTVKNSTEKTIAQLLSPPLTPTTEMCVRFWYWLPAGSTDSLTMHVLRSGQLSIVLWKQSGVVSSSWEVAEVTVSSPVEFKVVLQTNHSPDSNATMKVDDVSLRDGACHPPGSCDFESGQCNWINVHREDGHDWVLANGGFRGPEADHTTQTPEGWFLLSSSQHLNRSSVAHVLSEWIHLRETVCFSLWYHMNSSDSGMLRVYLRSGPSESQLMFHSNSSESNWIRFSQSVTTTRPFQVLIEAETNNKGFIAVDDITVTLGICPANETSSEFVGCSFENGTCGWEDSSVGQSQWVRGRNTSESFGPAKDHTVGTELGWYMALKPKTGENVSPAALQSPTMTQASTTCTLHFYYNIYVEDEAQLDVVMREGSQVTTLWRQTVGHEDVWRPGIVIVGRMPQDFSITFEGSRTFNKRGHVAIDDISFTNCTLPEPQPACPDNMFKCINSVCVESNQLCDYSDDCGDRSDEINCEPNGFEERCNFEQGLCSWENDVDTPHAKWIRQRGADAWPTFGPERDHTQNSAAGHYVIPEPHTTEAGRTSEMLSTTLLPSFNCTVRFYVFSLGDAAASLTVWSRTLGTGANDSLLSLTEISQSYNWQRAEATFSSSDNSKIVFRYERGHGHRGLVALDDISFSRECVFKTSPTSSPSTTSNAPSTTTSPTHPCQENEFFCWQSAGKVCVLTTKRCNYLPDCPQGEDEEGCGSCTFERDDCGWNDTSVGQMKWQRQKASNDTIPPSDHTTNAGYYMSMNFSQGSAQSEARLQSPPLPPSSPYCQILFHFHISTRSAGSLRVLMQQAEGSEAILWSRSDSTLSNWTPENLPIGLHQQPYRIWFSGVSKAEVTSGTRIIAVDDISFLNCEKSSKVPALQTYDCSFEDGLCGWTQGAEDGLDWTSGSGPTETPNTGPAGDHTTGKGKYLYINSSSARVTGDVAHLKTPLLPSGGRDGYCFTFWHHMFGATVGSLRVLLQTTDPRNKTMVWQKSGNQGDEWQLVQIHMTVQSVHQVILEATVGGKAGDIAVDDISLTNGPCSASDLCDFEEDSCGWQQQTDDDFDWVRQSGPSHNPNTGPNSDHTTNAPAGHYYYLSSSNADRAGQTARMSSPLYPAGKGSCVQLWYFMYGRGVGTLNIYQQAADETPALLFSQMGDQGRLWRFAQASPLYRDRPYRIMVEGVKAGPSQVGDMAFDDVTLTDAQCPSPGHCDFEINMCSWSNVGGVDEEDWLRGRGDQPNLNTGPSIDHTTNSSQGYYLYVDSSVGEWGDRTFLVSDVFHPSTRGHCLTFWYHMSGNHVGTLRVFLNDRKMHATGNEEGTLKWMESGNKGDKWQEASVHIKHDEAFWFVFVYQRGMTPWGAIALDDISVLPGGCYSQPPVGPPDENAEVNVGLAVGLTVLAGLILCIVLFMLNRKRKAM
ncbi:hypothetical protein fugu_014615 [Takifugu bimaculatus]|uniref:MAM domain-containing protein n=1 Tax=Takifugu bimaculatus TaxID=433685 RepID=A0A4Z2C1R8_9TELE|nr:hypothetical protein fugu_014615 [Takifugu bimaculatus]